MRRSIGRRAGGSLRWGRVVSGVGVLAVLAGGCPSSTEIRGSGAVRDVFRPVGSRGADEFPREHESLLDEALAGAPTAEETTLDGRMQVRALRIPHPPRGG